MPASAWRLKEQVARLRSDRFEATVDLRRPAEGLVEVCPGAKRPTDLQMLGIAIPGFPSGDARWCVDSYVRGASLIAAYEGPADRPMRIEAVWRLLDPTPLLQYIAALELVVSVRTHLPDSRAELAVQSELSASEAFRLGDAESPDCQPLAPLPEKPIVVRPDEDPGCLLLRPSDMELSYAEMVYPADFRGGQLVSLAEADGAMRVSHRLFSRRLEKGVILRARVRGMFLPRRQDRQIAAACYAAFAVAEPLLSP